MALVFRPFDSTDIGMLHQAFVDAFSHNQVVFRPSFEQFKVRVFEKLNLNPSVSFLAFEGEKVVGFNLHTVSDYHGKRTAYNGGIGVNPSFRKMGVATQLYEQVLPVLIEMNVNRILLEVISTNQAALHLYQSLGFRAVRRLKCFQLSADFRHAKPPVDIDFEPLSSVPSLVPDYTPAFLDATEQLSFNLRNERILAAMHQGKYLGYVVWQPALGRISQLLVDPTYRNRGLGRALVSLVSESSEQQVTIMNVPEEADSTIFALEKIGFRSELDQLEMELII